ncbi:PREDICTED: cAMP-responsive element-binding protein-like 2 isoform X1 [Drosophila arizonae]|uniref:cAMP-responsive element-binding protein-like 2 isoform X1 n=1 Tax=Drosophila arizonae TaxID=7263 RepID=A0ABM1Q0B8_DROAR|nr:PREDICTED: cAMP-responsive element-binding protein-like 2 isoform X1 [Drosophila arizonae]
MDCDSMQMAITEENQSTERKECGRRGRKPGRKSSSEKVDVKAKLERSRQSARECRARKKLRYQYLEELVADREKAVIALRAELERFMQCDRRLDEVASPNDIDQLLKDIGILKQETFT